MAWLTGSTALVAPYDHFIWGLTILSVGCQLGAIFVLLIDNQELKPCTRPCYALSLRSKRR
jgi:hypothetical protein